MNYVYRANKDLRWPNHVAKVHEKYAYSDGIRGKGLGIVQFQQTVELKNNCFDSNLLQFHELLKPQQTFGIDQYKVFKKDEIYTLTKILDRKGHQITQFQ